MRLAEQFKRPFRAQIRAIWRAPIDLILPPRCPGCGAGVDADGGLCSACWGGLDFIAEPCCARCGFPFEHAGAGSLSCGVCLSRQPVCERMRAALRYDEASRRLLLAFKHGDRTELAPALARLMMTVGSDLVREADIIAPIPLHWSRLLARRYNQAALLASSISRAGGRQFAPRLLIRRRRTPSQGGFDGAGRRRNVRAAFGVRHPLAGERILLIDDVQTTGATITEAARTLLRAGAGAVDSLSVARVVTGTRIPV